MTSMSDSDIVSYLEEFSSLVKEIILSSFNLESKIHNIQTVIEASLKEANKIMSNASFECSEDDKLTLAKGLLAKHVFRQSIEQIDFCEECRNDLSNEFARQQLDSEENPIWIKHWDSRSPKRKINAVLVYDPLNAFKHLFNLTKKEGFEVLVRELMSASQSGFDLDLKNYLSFLQTRFQQFSAKIDSTELKIINYLTSGDNVSISSLHEITGISKSWASRKITELKQRAILREHQRVPFSTISIRMFNLLISAIGVEDDPYRLLADCPFLYSYRKVLTGLWNALAVLCVPDNSDNIRSLSFLLDSLEKWGFSASLNEIIMSGKSVCFDSYECNEGYWHLHWELMELELNRILKEGLFAVLPSIVKPANKTDFDISDLDILILEEIRKRNNTISGIREKLKVGQSRLHTRIKQLRVARIILTSWEAHNLGLNESAIVITDDVDVGNALGAWALRFPKVILSYNFNKALVMNVQLPLGGVYGMTRALRNLSNNVTVGLLDSNIYGAWGFPVHHWNPEKQKWTYPKDQVEKWMQSLL